VLLQEDPNSAFPHFVFGDFMQSWQNARRRGVSWILCSSRFYTIFG